MKQVGPDINPKLIAIDKSNLSIKLGEEKMKNLMDRYDHPQNCGNLAAVKVNGNLDETKS